MDEQEVQSAVASLGGLFQGKTREEQMQLLAALERSGAAVYRALAANEPDASMKERLLGAAGREEENAEVLEAEVGSQ